MMDNFPLSLSELFVVKFIEYFYEKISFFRDGEKLNLLFNSNAFKIYLIIHTTNY